MISKRGMYVIMAVAGILGCLVVASMGLPLPAFIPPGAVATFGIGALVITSGEGE